VYVPGVPSMPLPSLLPALMSTPTRARTALFAVALALLAGCASRPPGRDGPEANPPPGLAQVPDAEPRVEGLRRGGPNKPYAVLGERYTPVTDDLAMRESGLASWYGRKFHGQPTASGEVYDMYAMTAAHKTMPIPSYARVRNPANGRAVIVRVNDRGPFVAGRVIDLSYTAALKLGLLGGVAPVEVERLTHDDIRAGLWQRAPALPMPAPEAAEEDALMALLASSASASPSASGVAADSAPAAGFWLQLGAFRQRDGAVQLQQRVQRDAEALAPRIAVFEDDATFRVQTGPFASRAAALAAADELRRLLQLAPLLLERR
jgi:rare lipoprotein A